MPYDSAIFRVSCADKSVTLQLKYKVSKDLIAMWTIYHMQAHITLTYSCSLMCCLHMHVLTFPETDGVRNTRYILENTKS